MRRPPLTTLLLTFALLVAAAPGVGAQVPIRVWGAIAKVSGQTLTVVSRDNSTVQIRLADNSTVTGVAKAALTLKHKGGLVRVIVPNNVPIVTFAAGDKTLLRPGAHVFIPAQQQADGTVTAARVLVGKDGLIPPM
ncbi:MAG TPA: hypothetical protein VIG37_26555 [Methylomirabilota bacterium]|jgi:hypothetical protein